MLQVILQFTATYKIRSQPIIYFLCSLLPTGAVTRLASLTALGGPHGTNHRKNILLVSRYFLLIKAVNCNINLAKILDFCSLNTRQIWNFMIEYVLYIVFFR